MKEDATSTAVPPATPSDHMARAQTLLGELETALRERFTTDTLLLRRAKDALEMTLPWLPLAHHPGAYMAVRAAIEAINERLLSD